MWILQAGDPKLTFRVMGAAVKTIGRATRADFIVQAPLVSRFHCRLTALENGGLEVQDLKSTNGTFVNDRRVARATLAPGDRLRVGRVDFQVLRAQGRRDQPPAARSRP